MKERVLLRGNGTFIREKYEKMLRQDDESNLMLTLGLTTRPGCNLDCKYCYNDGGLSEYGRKVPQSEWMSLDDYYKAIRQASQMGADSVTFVGIGETLMDPTVKLLIKSVKDNGMIPFVFTNVTNFIDEEMAKFLYKQGTTLYISLDSLDERTYAKIVGRGGMLKPTLEGIDNCIDAGYGGVWEENGHNVTNIAVNAMIVKDNYKELPEMKKYCDDRGILFTARVPSKIGSAEKNWDYLVGTDEVYQNLQREIEPYFDGGIPFRTDRGCLFWVTGIHLGLDGEARLCNAVKNKKPIGNIKTESLREIINNRNEVYPPSREYKCPLRVESER
jgi:MoaA/NifB/PqqE/SkfB family radical SAM enzyme